MSIVFERTEAPIARTADPNTEPEMSATGWLESAQSVPIGDVRPGATPRLTGEDEAHVRVLASTPGPLPPILVHRDTMAVVDGMHRLTAATLRGEQSIMAVFFEGTDADAFVEAVRLNVKHGKPLTLSDREEAAKRILSTHPHWSDRRIAEVCGMSPKTIARLRRALAADDPDLRIGRDGRVRPVDATQGRLQAAAIIERHPAASIREVAELAGTSSGTVRDVRRRLTQGRHPVPDRARENRESGRGATSRARHDWSKDAALRASDRGEVFVEWLDRTRIASDDWQAFVDTLPLSRLYLISEESRRRSDEWARFASQLEDRARKNE